MLQIILTATKWTPKIKKFVCLGMYDPFICIASFIEVVVFKSLRPKLYFLRSKYKNQRVSGKVTAGILKLALIVTQDTKFLYNFMSEILTDDYTILRTMVVCINAEEAEHLNAVLIPTKKTILIHEKMKLFDILGTVIIL